MLKAFMYKALKFYAPCNNVSNQIQNCFLYYYNLPILTHKHKKLDKMKWGTNYLLLDVPFIMVGQ
jgi:hypothetical protein